MNPGNEDVPKIYTSRYKKSEKVLKSCFVVLFIALAAWILKIILLDSISIATNAYNPRLTALESRYIRGALLDRNGNALAHEVQAEDGSYSRQYPYGSALGLVTGYSSQSKSGLELAANSYLLSAGSFEDVIHYWILDQTIPGCDVVTTLDGPISQYAYDRLGDYKGVVILTEADTGRTLTLVSKPAYDPNTVMEEWDSLMEDDENPFFNRATQGLYPPGSTFKMITSRRGLEVRSTNRIIPIPVREWLISTPSLFPASADRFMEPLIWRKHLPIRVIRFTLRWGRKSKQTS